MPKFCNGPCALISKQGSKKLFKTASETKNPRFPLEDVLFTGIYRTLANLPDPNLLPGVCEHLMTTNKLNAKLNTLRKKVKNEIKK